MIKERAKEFVFFIAAFLLFSWLLSFLAPSPEPVQPAPQIIFPEFSAADWIMAMVAIGAPSLMILTIWFLRTRPVIPQMQLEGEASAIAEIEMPQVSQPHRHIILNNPHAKPEVVLRLTAQLADAERKCTELQAQLDARPAPEPERELTYAAVLALVQTGGRVSINAAQKLIRENKGVVGRDYKPLQEVLSALAALSAPYPTVQDTPIHEPQPSVNGECEAPEGAVNGEAGEDAAPEGAPAEVMVRRTKSGRKIMMHRRAAGKSDSSLGKTADNV